ncbi:MAG: class I SAM-dependent methyltransferase, partial [Vicinamibacterales bacterium]
MRDAKAYFYDSIANEFEALTNSYDTKRRLEVVFDELLGGQDLRDRTLLDVGCGSGWFSERAAARGARVVSLDIGLRLLAQTARRCRTRPVAADACQLPFADGVFDVVVSSECIEHTPAPRTALEEICRVVRPGGAVVVTVPNQRWHFAVSIANALSLRPYRGYENWLGWGEVRQTLQGVGVAVEAMRGIHLFPFVIPVLNPLLRRIDVYGEQLGPIMVNIAV